MRLQLKPGTKSDQVKTSLNGHDFRVEVDSIVTTESGLQASKYYSLYNSEMPQTKNDFLFS